MKSYVTDLTTYGMNGQPTAYDFETASLLWAAVDELNESLRHHTVTLRETNAGTLVLTVEPNETEKTFLRKLEAHSLAQKLEEIADEYGFFEIPSRYLMGAPEVNELIAVE